VEQNYFRRGFGLRKEIEPLIRSEYHSALVDRIRASGYEARFGDVTVRLAEEFGFCYGVDRAVDYAYETRLKFPDRRVFLLGEIIHNPHVNRRLTEMGITFLLPDAGGRFDPHSYHWWKVFSTLRWGVGLCRQSVQHLNGTYRNIAMATSGRRAVELEYDLLRLLRPVL